MRRSPKAWKVWMAVPACPYGTSRSTRACISSAAFSVKVRARISSGRARLVAMSQAMRWVTTRVLPVPGPASTSSGPSPCVTAPPLARAVAAPGPRPPAPQPRRKALVGAGVLERVEADEPHALHGLARLRLERRRAPLHRTQLVVDLVDPSKMGLEDGLKRAPLGSPRDPGQAAPQVPDAPGEQQHPGEGGAEHEQGDQRERGSWVGHPRILARAAGRPRGADALSCGRPRP